MHKLATPPQPTYTMLTLDALTTMFSFGFAPAFGVGFLICVTDDKDAKLVAAYDGVKTVETAAPTVVTQQ
jgi:hypothetical protein